MISVQKVPKRYSNVNIAGPEINEILIRVQEKTEIYIDLRALTDKTHLKLYGHLE